MSLQNIASSGEVKKDPLSRDLKQNIARTRKPVENSTAGGEERRSNGPRAGSGAHLRPAQKSSCHLTCLVTVIINGLVDREREDFMVVPGLVPALQTSYQ